MTKKYQHDSGAGSLFIDGGPAGSTLIPKGSFDEPSHTPIAEVHPQPEPTRIDFDPNARNAARARQNDVGAGIASGLEGDLSSRDTDGAAEVVLADAIGISKRRFVEMPGGSRGQNNWYNVQATRAEQQRGMTRQQIAEQKAVNDRGRTIVDEIIRLGLKD